MENMYRSLDIFKIFDKSKKGCHYINTLKQCTLA